MPSVARFFAEVLKSSKRAASGAPPPANPVQAQIGVLARDLADLAAEDGVGQARIPGDLRAERVEHGLDQLVAIDSPDQRRQRRDGLSHPPIVTRDTNIGVRPLASGRFRRQA